MKLKALYDLDKIAFQSLLSSGQASTWIQMP